MSLTDYSSAEPERHRYVRHIFDDTSANYDKIERPLAFAFCPGYSRQALRGAARPLRVDDRSRWLRALPGRACHC